MSNLQLKKKEPSISIVIVNWNRKILLEACLNSIEKTTEYSNYSVIVVDNGSSDGSIGIIKNKFPLVNLIALKQNTGFSIGNNIGIATALKDKTDYVLLLNNDTLIIQSDWLKKLVAVTEENKKIGILGCKLIFPNGGVQHVGSRLDLKGLQWINPQCIGGFPEVFEVDVVLGACFLIKRAVIDLIGFLDEGFSPFQHEEADFCFRTKKAGYSVFTTLNVEVVHVLGASIKSGHSDFINRKNLIRLMLLNFSLRWFAGHSVYEVRELLYCFLERNKVFKKKSLFILRIRKDWRKRTSDYLLAWLFNVRNLGEILVKRRNRSRKIMPKSENSIYSDLYVID